MKSAALLVAFILLLAAIGCKKGDSAQQQHVLRSLYKYYKNGEIDECTLNGKLVYLAELNAYDAGAEIYDSEGKKIGDCNYAWGHVDAICRQLKSREVIYRCKDHLSGEPFVDKYGINVDLLF